MGVAGRCAGGTGAGVASSARRRPLRGAVGTVDGSGALPPPSRPRRNGPQVGFGQVQHADDVRRQREDDVGLLRLALGCG